ncbi:PEP-CTERM sorting domain-containing protein [Coraliomargarita parva]|uniref:PEP-CTERM sorting domain-containing protein n=1 Tax=Coraliomargarita parva TaxID=3014050 RepID=UPI0022B59E32|nr:PEP-CTERM sorting domain-containing protein [Coraliomargarita parva]
MKKLILLTASLMLGFAGAMSAQDLIAAWDFNYTSSFGGLDVDGDFINDSSATANFGLQAGTATFSWLNQTSSGLSNSADLDSNQLLRPLQIASMNDGFGWFVDANVSSSAELFLTVDLSLYGSSELTFAAGSDNGPVDLLVDVDGAVTTLNLTAGTDALYTVDLSALAGSSSAVVGLSFDNFTGTDNVFLDNFQITGVGVVPEPSTYAAIFGVVALLFAAHRRRK